MSQKWTFRASVFKLWTWAQGAFAGSGIVYGDGTVTDSALYAASITDTARYGGTIADSAKYGASITNAALYAGTMTDAEKYGATISDEWEG